MTPAQIRGRSKLIETLHQVSKVFFTDKGQKLFESAQVNLFENPELALGQLREAQGLEDENILVLAQLARAQIIKQDCDSALVTLEMARSLDPHSNEAALLELRALLCAKRYEVFHEKLKTASAPGAPGTSDKWEQAFGQFLSAQDHLRQNASHKAFEILAKVKEDFPQFPETYYYLAKAGQSLEKETSPWLQKYSSLCKGITLRERKKFSLEPQLCGRIKEVDEELAAVKHES
jgi:predicted Zn-dependent protease